MSGVVEHLFHYPIKGLSSQSLDHVNLQIGQGFPMDRAFGFARPDSGFDPKAPRPLPKTKFVMLARDEALAQLDTSFDQDRQILTIAQDNRAKDFDISDPKGRAEAAAHIADHLGYTPDDHPTLYSAAPHRFTDVSVDSVEMMNAISLINLDSVADFVDRLGQAVDPARFRANILFSGFPAMSELNMIGATLAIGEARMKIVRRTKRCSATQVNLDTATRDLDVPQLLREQYDHSDMGVYAQVTTGGPIAVGDEIIFES